MSAMFKSLRPRSSCVGGASSACVVCRIRPRDGIQQTSSTTSSHAPDGAPSHHSSQIRCLSIKQSGRSPANSATRWLPTASIAFHSSLCWRRCALEIAPVRRLSIHTHGMAHGSVTVPPFIKCTQNTLHISSDMALPHTRLFSSSFCYGFRDTVNAFSDVASERDPTQVEDDYVKDLSEALLEGERWALARAITLVEATHKKGKKQAQFLLRRVLDHLKEVQIGNRGIPSSFRVGLTGPPGAGKSTFIEAMGKKLTAEGHRVAVLAVDPSSSITGGSLLGDKTRMTELSRDPNAYIRASPSSGTLGGVTRNTNDTILLCEAAGYDVIMVETVGVGQSEYVVADMVDMLVLLIPPAGGDELQGLKKGIVERADFILVNKADGELLIPARRMRSEYTSAVKLMYNRSLLWKPKVKQVSSKTGDGLDQAWDIMEEYRGIMRDAGELVRKRQRQRRVWMWQHIQDRMMEEFRESQELKVEIGRWEEEVMAERCTSGIAADELLKKFSKLSRDF